MPKDSSHLTGLIKQVISLIKFIFLLLITIIAVLAGALAIIFNLYRHEKKSAKQPTTEPGEAPNSSK